MKKSIILQVETAECGMYYMQLLISEKPFFKLRNVGSEQQNVNKQAEVKKPSIQFADEYKNKGSNYSKNKKNLLL